MKFIKAKPDDATEAIYKRLQTELSAEKRVLWLVSGGSNIKVEIKVMSSLLKNESGLLSNLSIMPIDERYGEQGHKDSNIRQMRDAGLKTGNAVLIDVLAHNFSFDRTIEFYNDVATTAFSSADTVIAQVGLGADGHILGIKPNSPACTDSSSTVIGYKWDDFDRMTLSIAAVQKINTAFILAYGDNKSSKLKELQKNTSNIQDLPAELLYSINEAYVYNDSVGD